MFLELTHERLDIFYTSKEFVTQCYKATGAFPLDERFALTQQIRRAAVSVHLNIAEGCSRKSIAERKRFFEISRGSSRKKRSSKQLRNLTTASFFIPTQPLNTKASPPI